MTTTGAIVLVLAFVLTGCATPNPPLTLAERFERVALRDDAGRPVDNLMKWSRPIEVGYVGDPAYRDDVMRHAELLGQIAGLPVRYVEFEENMLVRIVDRLELRDQANAAAAGLYGRDFGPDVTSGFSCFASWHGSASRYYASVGIADDLPDWQIRRCIVQEMTQILGLFGDLDGRTDTNFTSGGKVVDLTEDDIALLHILYDPRLVSGMSREQVLAILPDIIDDPKEPAATSR